MFSEQILPMLSSLVFIKKDAFNLEKRKRITPELRLQWGIVETDEISYNYVSLKFRFRYKKQDNIFVKIIKNRI